MTKGVADQGYEFDRGDLSAYSPLADLEIGVHTSIQQRHKRELLMWKGLSWREEEQRSQK